MAQQAGARSLPQLLQRRGRVTKKAGMFPPAYMFNRQIQTRGTAGIF